jgi:uncharacterized coiled-coil DUF342 family protein
MWKIVLTTLQNLLTLARDLEENRKEIKELNEKIYKLASAVRSLSEKIDSNAQHEASERKALILQLENDLLKAEKKGHLLKRGKTDGGSKKVARKR